MLSSSPNITIFSNPKTGEKRRFPENPQEMKHGKKSSVLHFPTATEKNQENPGFAGISLRRKVLKEALSIAVKLIYHIDRMQKIVA